MSELPVIVLGGGGHARVLIDVLELRGVRILGITDPAPELVARRSLGLRVLGDDETILEHDPAEVLLVNGVGSTRPGTLRRRLFERFSQRGYRFATVIHPSAVVARSALLDEGVQVMAGAVVQPHSALGANCLLNTRSSVDHDCVLGAHVHLAPGATLSGEVRVGQGAHIGTGATVIEGIRIGEDAMVAAGAVVVRDVGRRSTVMGVPARPRAADDDDETTLEPG